MTSQSLKCCQLQTPGKHLGRSTTHTTKRLDHSIASSFLDSVAISSTITRTSTPNPPATQRVTVRWLSRLSMAHLRHGRHAAQLFAATRPRATFWTVPSISYASATRISVMRFKHAETNAFSLSTPFLFRQITPCFSSFAVDLSRLWSITTRYPRLYYISAAPLEFAEPLAISYSLGVFAAVMSYLH